MIAKHHEDRWTKLISNGSPTISTFSPSPKHRDRILQCGLLLQPRSRRVHVTFFVLVRVEKRDGHACCACAIRLLETQKKVEDASRARIGVELGTNTSYIVSSPLNSLATNRALIPSILFSRSQRIVTRFFPFCFYGVVSFQRHHFKIFLPCLPFLSFLCRAYGVHLTCTTSKRGVRNLVSVVGLSPRAAGTVPLDSSRGDWSHQRHCRLHCYG